jgi:hypothetical protein
MSNVDKNKKVTGPYPKYDNNRPDVGSYGIGLDMVDFPTKQDDPDPKLTSVKPKEV